MGWGSKAVAKQRATKVLQSKERALEQLMRQIDGSAGATGGGASSSAGGGSGGDLGASLGDVMRMQQELDSVRAELSEMKNRYEVCVWLSMCL